MKCVAFARAFEDVLSVIIATIYGSKIGFTAVPVISLVWSIYQIVGQILVKMYALSTGQLENFEIAKVQTWFHDACELDEYTTWSSVTSLVGWNDSCASCIAYCCVNQTGTDIHGREFKKPDEEIEHERVRLHKNCLSFPGFVLVLALVLLIIFGSLAWYHESGYYSLDKDCYR